MCSLRRINQNIQSSNFEANRMGVKTWTMVKKMLTDKDPEVRQYGAITCSSRIYRHAKRFEALIPLWQDKHESVRWCVADSLGLIGDERAIEPLVSMLDDQSETVRISAAHALGEIGDNRAIEPLTSKLDSQSEKMKKAVISSLERIEEER